MERKDIRNILPLAVVRGDSGTALLRGEGDHLVDHSQALCLSGRLDRASRVRLGIKNTIEPVAYPKMQ